MRMQEIKKSLQEKDLGVIIDKTEIIRTMCTCGEKSKWYIGNDKAKHKI